MCGGGGDREAAGTPVMRYVTPYHANLVYRPFLLTVVYSRSFVACIYVLRAGLYDPTGVEAVESISTISLCPGVLSTLETHSENLASCCLCIHMNTGKLRGGNAPTSCARAAVLASRSAPSAPRRSALRQVDAQHSPFPAKACSCNRWSAIRREDIISEV